MGKLGGFDDKQFTTTRTCARREVFNPQVDLLVAGSGGLGNAVMQLKQSGLGA